MKKLVLFLLTNIPVYFSFAQTYWQQKVDYNITVLLNEKEKTLDAFEQIHYTNNSPDTLHFIWFHLYPNAYKNDNTAFSDQLLLNGNTSFYFADKEKRGYINRLDFKVDGTTTTTEDHPQHIDIVKVHLPKPIPPKAQVTITTPFHVKLPYNFSRGGYDGESFQITQWYPKPAVYDRYGWHPMPYLDQGEFYSEFGSFDVQITVPSNYVVAATGELQTETEKAWLRERAGYSLPVPAKAQTPSNKQKSGKGRAKTKTANLIPMPSSQPVETKILHYKQDNIHDFAWFANKNFIVNSDTLKLTSGRTILVSAFYTPAQKEHWRSGLLFAKEALKFYSARVGEYPYNIATIVQGPESFGGGMEYPTITILSPVTSAQTLDGLIAHELGHNWFYGILASNERDHPWMDEGINTFYEGKYMQQSYGPQAREAELLFQHKAKNKTDQPIQTPSTLLSETNYALVAYHKTAEWLKGIEQKVGKDAFRQMMQQYFEEWKFKHPHPDDFKKLLATKLGNETTTFLTQLQTKGVLPHNHLTETSVVMPIKKTAIENYLKAPTKNLLLLSPLIGFNVYDRAMIGGLATNYGSPGARFNFFAAPLFAAGTASLTGVGRLNLAVVSNGSIRKTDIFLNAASFHADEFRDGEGKKYPMRFVKLVPGIRFTLREKSLLNSVSRYVQWKTFFITEQALRIRADSVFRAADTVVTLNYSTPGQNRYLNQLQFVFQNPRALYPFDLNLHVEQAQDFIRTTFTGNYFFNYAKGGGLALRLFAGKFSYLNERTIRRQFATDRYHLNLTGPKGFEDYTYSDYFIGRNRFGDLPSQQIMIRDGAFKVRTDMLASKVGKTDNWLTAINFVSTIPDKVNPFSALPFKIPLRVFADVGTYAEAWDKNADTNRFLFDAGLQLSLLRESVQVYIPLLYSKVYRNYFKSTIPDNRFLKTISFSINLYNPALKKLNRELEF